MLYYGIGQASPLVTETMTDEGKKKVLMTQLIFYGIVLAAGAALLSRDR